MVVKSPDRSLRSLDGVRPLYMLPTDPLAEEVLIKGFQEAGKVDCMVGFFSSEILASLAPGLATYITRSENSFRLIISPLLQAEDLAAIEKGQKSAEEIADMFLEDLTVTEDLLQRHTLKCLSWLLRERRIEIKIALMKEALFHPKVWLFEERGDVIAAHGSSNGTYAGIAKNIEQISVARSWQDRNQGYTTNKLRCTFDRFWEDKDENCLVIPLSEAVRQRLLHKYSSGKPPTEDELRALHEKALGLAEEPVPSKTDHCSVSRTRFTIPDWLRYEDGPFEHQGRAVTSWCANEHRGVLEMATGSGKTITSMIAAHRLYEVQKPLLIVVAAPYLPLIEQWCDEIVPFGINPVNLTKPSGVAERMSMIQAIKRRFRTGLSDVDAVVVSHNTLCKQYFLDALRSFDCARLLIADEVHNLGRLSFIENLPEFFEHRLGLSATPIRQYDEEGTNKLLSFFGPIVSRFTLEEAIGLCLVEYDYYVHPVHLTEGEIDHWFVLTDKIKQHTWRSEEGNPDNYLAKLLRDRRALLETASGKIAKLKDILDWEDAGKLRHTLVYTSDKGPDQINNVNRLLRNKNILYQQLTAEETSDREQTKRIIQSFQDEDIQVLTAKRVLDEGVNIPQICKAFVLASTTVERQWVQRRGRLLRTCSAVGKTHSVIHDLLALPPEMDDQIDPDLRTLVRGELRRVQEFARLARNAGRPNGPLPMIEKMVAAAYL